MIRPSTPPSSRISLSAASAALSPGTTCPFGKIHWLGSFLALTSNTSADAPCPRTTTAPAWMIDGTGEDYNNVEFAEHFRADGDRSRQRDDGARGAAAV